MVYMTCPSWKKEYCGVECHSPVIGTGVSFVVNFSGSGLWCSNTEEGFIYLMFSKQTGTSVEGGWVEDIVGDVSEIVLGHLLHDSGSLASWQLGNHSDLKTGLYATAILKCVGVKMVLTAEQCCVLAHINYLCCS